MFLQFVQNLTMNLRKLNHFLAVVESRNMRLAAEAVHLSQPALSRSLKSLEDELGIELFDRAYGKIVPTTYSSTVVDHIRRLASEERALKESVRRIKGLDEGEIRVGFGPFAAADALRPVAGKLLARYPKLTLKLELANSPLLIELLDQGRLDVVICDSRYLTHDIDMKIHRLPRQPIAFVAGRDNPLHSRRNLHLEDLRAHTIGSPTLPPDLLAAFHSRGFEDFPSVYCDDMHVLLDLAAASPLVAMVPELVVRNANTSSDIKSLNVKVPFEPYAYPCILHARERKLGPAGTLMLELMQEQLSTEVTTVRAKSSRKKRTAN